MKNERGDVKTLERAPRPQNAQRHLVLWTPERVPLTVKLAGLGERALAYLVDVTLLGAGLFAVAFLYNVWGDLWRDATGLSGVGAIVVALCAFAAGVLYDTLFEVLADGRTPSKRALRLRVVRRDGLPPDLLTAVLRNTFRLLDFLPGGYGVGIVALFFTGTQRLGDLVAGTYVVVEHARGRDALAPARAAVPDDGDVRLPRLDDDGALLALEVLARTQLMHESAGAPLCARTLARVAPGFVLPPGGSPRRELAALVRAQVRVGGVLAVLADLVAHERALMMALASLRMARTVDDVMRIDGAVRAAGSALVRAERLGVPAKHREALSLALLEAERRRHVSSARAGTWRTFFAIEVPRTVWRERALVARAGFVLAIGLGLGFVLAFSDAELARALVGDDLAARIEHGANWTDRIAEDNSFAGTAVTIILNNVGVGLRVFALGLLGGVASILGLLSNGVQIGAAFGYAARLGTAGTLARFILAHGPVELTMVSIAGAAGLCLGRALLSPGRRTRAVALREEGAVGGKLVVAAAIGLIGIGTVEGFVSPGRYMPWGVNAAIGVALWLLYAAWVRSARPQP